MDIKYSGNMTSILCPIWNFDAKLKLTLDLHDDHLKTMRSNHLEGIGERL